MERNVYKKISKEYEISEESIYAEVLKRVKPAKGFRTVSNIEANKLRMSGRKETVNLKRAIERERILLSVLSIDNSVYRVVKDRVES